MANTTITPSISPQCSPLKPVLGVSAWLLLTLAGGIILLRRLSGGFTLTLPLVTTIEALLLCAVVLCSTYDIIETECRRRQVLERRMRFLLTFLLPLTIWSAALFRLNTIFNWVMAALFLTAVAVLFLQRSRLILWCRETVRNWTALQAEESLHSPSAGVDAVEVDRSRDPRELEIQEDPDMTQRLVRHQSNGVDSLVSEHRIQFAPGEKLVYLHCGFTPPFAGIPHLETRCDQSHLRIVTGVCYPHGARLEIRRTEADHTETAVLVVHCTGPASTYSEEVLLSGE